MPNLDDLLQQYQSKTIRMASATTSDPTKEKIKEMLELDLEIRRIDWRPRQAAKAKYVSDLLFAGAQLLADQLRQPNPIRLWPDVKITVGK